MFSKLQQTPLLLAILSLPLLTSTQTAAADGTIVPFTSVLPACASLCGPLFDVQGACSPPVVAAVSVSCFCSDARLKPFLTGTAGVETVCGAASCQDAADLAKIQSWYETECGDTTTSSTTMSGSTVTGASTATSTLAASKSTTAAQGWYVNSFYLATSGAANIPNLRFAGHWRWVVFIIVVVLGLAIVWICAALLRRRYIRKKEREIEMRPPVAWGPHQMQAATAGYKDGTYDISGGAAKEARSEIYTAPSDRKKKGHWLSKSRT